MKKATIHSDGASSGNPGAAGIGGVIKLEGNTHEFSRYIGITTNNVAEYTALIEAVEKAIELGAEEAEVFVDSELVERQINGIYKVRHENIKPLFEKAMALLKSLRRFSVKHIPRELNAEADALSKEAVKKSKTPD